jgi:LysM domain
MQTITISEGQTLVDIAARYCGDAALAIDIAMLNGIDIDDIQEGDSLILPDVAIDKKAIVENLLARKNNPASALTAEEAIAYEDEWTLYYTVGLPPTHG